MKEVKISIGNRIYNVELAETEEDQLKGLSGRKTLHEDNGMLFLFNENEEVGFNTIEMLFPIDVIFLDEEGIVTQMFTGQPGSEEILSGDASYVLEVNIDSGIKIGDELEFEPTDNKEISKKMLVLNSNAEVQMELEGGERIFSRDSTKILIKKAKKANILKSNASYKSLGTYIFKELYNQDNRDPEYVKLKN